MPRPSKCFLLELPVEVFEQILFSIPLFDTVTRHSTCPPHRPVTESQITILLRVCRTIRRFLHSASFWLATDFDLISLLPQSSLSGNQPFRMLHLQTILSDPFLSLCLERKHAWTFKHPETLKAAATALPKFRDTVKEIHLRWVPGMDHVLDSVMRPATGVELVEILGPGRGPNLHSLAAAFPKTTDLSIYTWNGPDADIDGSLGELEYLHKLKIELQVGDMRGGIWTPFKSLERITNITLQCPSDIRLRLEYFNALTHADIAMSACHLPVFFGCLGPWSLKSLKLRVLHTNLKTLEFMDDFHPLPALSLLQSLHLHLSENCDEADKNIHLCTVLLREFSRISTLERLSLIAPSDTTGARSLAQLKNLKVLKWTVDNKRWCEGWTLDGDPIDLRMDGYLRLFIVDPNTFFQKVFSNFATKPDISIEITQD